MVSLIKYGALSGGEKYNTNILEIDGLSTDTKPITTFIEYGVDGREIGRTNIENGSTFTEIDTGKLFMYDAENTVWYEIETSGGGGGGGTGTDNYNLLTNKPKINNVEIKGNKSLVDLGILFGSSLVAEIDSNTYVVTLTLKDQEGNILGETQSLDLPLESVVVGGRYDNTTKKVVLILQNGNTVEFSVADLVDGLQSELSSTNKLNPEFINYNSTHRAVSDTEKSTWNGKQDALTFDNTPTNGSNNPVKSGGIYTALDNKVNKVTGKGLSTNDFTNADKAQITTNKNGIAALANSGSKNRLNTYLAAVKPLNFASTGSWSDNVYTHNGVTFTVNDDGSLTINGTSTGSGSDFVFSRNAGTSFGGLVLTGSLSSDSGDAGISIVCKQQNDAEIGRSRNGQPYTIPTGISVDKIVIHLNAGEKETNRTMYPIIRDASIEDSTYVPYAPSNRELYEMILALQSGS